MGRTMAVSTSTGDAARALDVLIAAARAAGASALGHFRHGATTSAQVFWKDGGSPVTVADHEADAYLRDRLGRAFPEAGWLSEETADDARRLDRRHVLVVDPIDGTRAFMRGDERWAVCAALVEDGRPIAGVVHLPARGETFAAARGAGATLEGAPIRVSRHATLKGARASGPKPLIEGFNAAGAGLVTMEREPSLAYRIVSVAVGRLDIAFASARSHDWDLAAADLILQEAGGALTDLEGVRPLYNRPETRHSELAAAPIALSQTLLSAARRARR
jgi:myo-inositol-1(or 4)-monophosphatase